MKKMKAVALALVAFAAAKGWCQTDVTDTYMQNPNFEARYAGWLNEGTTKGAVGGFVHQTNSSFYGKDGEVYLEKWVSAGSKVSNCDIYQTLTLPSGTYMLVVAAQNLQGGTAGTGAYLYAGDVTAEVGDSTDYSVTFSVGSNPVTVGFKTVSATGNWVCLDNFRLYQLDDDDEAIAAQQAADDAELEELKANLQSAIDNGATAPTVETNPYIATGVTIALGRSTITTNGTTIKERGFCWSLDPDPTILDNRTTEYFTNNGRIYRMENLEPATMYYMRAYAMTSDYAVGYGDVVRVATRPKGSVSYWYNYGGSTEENYRINSALEETVWMYNNLAYITGFGISCTYGSSTATADCSYGGSMRVGPSTSYQQTGTLLHETNHGVGVGTTTEWYSNSALRESTSYGRWLGSCATELVRFLENDETAYVTGDGTHMWGTNTSGNSIKAYGINGASEDSYNPSDQLLYWGNIMITHALHTDGLPCSSSVGFAVPTFVFEQWDSVKYYIKSEVTDYGTTCFLGHSSSGLLRNYEVSTEEALADDSYAWYIGYNPKTGYYTFKNVSSGKFISLSSSTIKATTSAGSIHLLPSREKVTMGDFSAYSYWITMSKGSYALKAGSSSCSTTSYDNSSDATAQRWLFLTADQLDAYETGAVESLQGDLSELIANVRATAATEHYATSEEDDVEEIDDTLETTLATIEEAAVNYTSAAEFTEAISTIQTALTTFLAAATPTDVANPFDITYLLENAALDDDASGWSDSPTFSYSCCEYYTTSSFDFYQTTSIKLPKGTYEVKAQGFQRPGSYADVYTDYVTNGTNNVNATLYAKTKSVTLKNIFDDYTTTSKTGAVAAATKVYIPNTMQGASNYFAAGLYDNSVMTTTSSSATFKLGIKGSATGGTNYWTCFDNFRLYYYGGWSTDDVTPVEAIVADETDISTGKFYDLSGRQVSRPERGIYIQNGKKILVK